MTLAEEKLWRAEFGAAMADYWPSESTSSINALTQRAFERWPRLPAHEAARMVFDQWSHLTEDEQRADSSLTDGLSTDRQRKST